MNKSLVIFEFEKSTLHTIAYGAINTSKTYFVRQYLKLYWPSCFTDQNEIAEQDRKQIVIVCKDQKDWTNLEKGKPYADFNMCEITSKNIDYFENSVIVIDDMGNKLKDDIAEFFAGGRYDDIQMMVLGHKPAQIVNTARVSCDTIYKTTFNGADLFKNFNEIYK